VTDLRCSSPRWRCRIVSDGQPDPAQEVADHGQLCFSIEPEGLVHPQAKSAEHLPAHAFGEFGGFNDDAATILLVATPGDVSRPFESVERCSGHRW